MNKLDEVAIKVLDKLGPGAWLIVGGSIIVTLIVGALTA